MIVILEVFVRCTVDDPHVQPERSWTRGVSCWCLSVRWTENEVMARAFGSGKDGTRSPGMMRRRDEQ